MIKNIIASYNSTRMAISFFNLNPEIYPKITAPININNAYSVDILEIFRNPNESPIKNAFKHKNVAIANSPFESKGFIVLRNLCNRIPS